MISNEGIAGHSTFKDTLAKFRPEITRRISGNDGEFVGEAGGAESAEISNSDGFRALAVVENYEKRP